MTLEVIVTNELAMPMMADGMTVTISYLGIQIARLTVNNREVDPGSAVGMDGEQDSVTLSQHPEILNKFFAAIVNGHPVNCIARISVAGRTGLGLSVHSHFSSSRQGGAGTAVCLGRLVDQVNSYYRGRN